MVNLLSTPFWEFHRNEKAVELERKSYYFLLPFGSFYGAGYELVSAVGHESTFYSLLGVSGYSSMLL